MQHAVTLQIRQWEKDLSYYGVVRDSLSAQIDQYAGEPGPELNKLVARFIDAKAKADAAAESLARVRDKTKPITG